MSTSRFSLSPLSATYPSANAGRLQGASGTNRHPALLLDASTSQTAYWDALECPLGYIGPWVAVIRWTMASATTGNIILRAYIEPLTDGGATNLHSATNFGSANASATIAVPGTAGIVKYTSITLTNDGGVAPGDMFRFAIDRDAANVSDTATGDLELELVALRDAA